jgi:hypothetical protein
MCGEDGLCAVVDGSCTARNDADCKKSEACSRDGRCSARNGVCVTSCQDSQLCRELGLCDNEREKGKPARCVTASDAACEKSDGCKKLGACSRTSDGCRAGDDVECRQSTACLEFGRCTFQRGRCVARSVAECQAATVSCKMQGRCKYDESRGCVE